MEREPIVGECLVVTRANGDQSLKPGVRLIVTHVDDGDSTIRGLIAGSPIVNDEWIPWSNLEAVRFGWGYIQSHLPPDLITILTACEGIDSVGLNPDVKRAILATLPDLKLRIQEAVQSIEADDELS